MTNTIELTKRISITNAQIDEMPTVKYKDGNGYEHTYVDLNSDIWPREGIIRFETLRKNERLKSYYLSVGRYKDKKSGAYFAIVTGIDDDKKIKHGRIPLGGITMFDLSIPDERKKAIIVMNSPFVEGSRNQRGKPELKVISQEEKAINYLSNRQKKKKAGEYADSLNASDKIDFCYMIGIDPTINSSLMIEEAIFKYADEQPEKFINLFEDPRRNAIIVFKRALKNGLISSTPEAGFVYQGMSLGITEQQAVIKIGENPAIMFSIDSGGKNAIEKSITVEKNTATNDQKKKTVVEDIDDEEELLRVIAEQQARLDAIKARKSGEKIFSEEEVTKLKAQAKHYGIKGFGILSPKKLEEVIKKHEQTLIPPDQVGSEVPEL